MKIWKRWASVGVLALFASGGGVHAAQADPADAACSSFTVGVTRMENVASGAALLTQFPSELTSAGSYGFIPEPGVAFRVSETSEVDVWRMYNTRTNDFTWAADGVDLQSMLNAGYTKEFRQFKATGVGGGCLSPAHRLVKGDKSRVVVGNADRDGLLRDGWTLAASGMFYAVAATPEQGGGQPGEDVPGVDVDAAEFTIAVMPDTQQETWSDSDPRLKNRSQWLAANAERENLKFVTHAGDVVDWGNVSPAQYTRVKDGLAPLGGKIPYSLTVGNHDTAAVCQGGSACPGRDASIDVRDTTAFNAAFGGSMFTNMRGQFEPGKVDNSYSTFEASGEKWMVLNLELWPRQVAIDWAKKIVASHQDHNVVVATHAYLNSDGSIGQSQGGYGATSPKHLFDTLIKVYPNIKIVVSGHTGMSASRIDAGVNGNKILSLLQCFHSQTTNPVRLIKINAAAGSVTNWVYAPYTSETLVASQTITGFDFNR